MGEIATGRKKSPMHVKFVLVPRFNMMTLTTTIEPMRIANYLAPSELYKWEYLSVEGGDIVASNGMAVASHPLCDADSSVDIAFICGSWGCEHYIQPSLFNWLRRLERKGVMLIALETGVFALARAGLMADRLATTHWSVMAGFSEQFPQIEVREQLFTVDGNLLTCAGAAVGLDLMLHLIADRHGEQLAAEIADQLMHYPVRPGDSPQRRTMGALTNELHPDVKAVIALIEAHIDEPLSVPDIAGRVGISQRQLERLFKRHLGCSIVQFGQLLRLQYARVLLTSTRMSIREVSAACGFNSMSYFSQAFTKCFSRKPSEYRLAWPETEPAPAWPGTVYSFVTKSRLEAKP